MLAMMDLDDLRCTPSNENHMCLNLPVAFRQPADSKNCVKPQGRDFFQKLATRHTIIVKEMVKLRGTITIREVPQKALDAWHAIQGSYEGFQVGVDRGREVVEIECWNWLCSPRSGEPAFTNDDVSEHVFRELMRTPPGDPSRTASSEAACGTPGSPNRWCDR